MRNTSREGAGTDQSYIGCWKDFSLAESYPAVRTQLHRQINTGIDATLVADPDAEIPLYDHLHLGCLTKALHLSVDMTQVSDESLGIRHRIYPQPGSPNHDNGDPP